VALKPTIDHRAASRRIAHDAPCTVFFDGFRRSGTVRNLSVGGVYVALSEPPPVHSRAVLTFSLAGDRTHIACEGIVRWINEPSMLKACGLSKPALPPGCGIEFLQMAGIERRWIDALVRLVSIRQGPRARLTEPECAP
jgi:hypothetical protein